MKDFYFNNTKYLLDKEYWEKQYRQDPMVCNTVEFQSTQLQYLLENRDYTTLQNRINNMLKWGGIKKVN